VLSSGFGPNSVQSTSEMVDPLLGHYGDADECGGLDLRDVWSLDHAIHRFQLELLSGPET
jgi:hypothetical protein